jgi:glucokinase
MVRPYSIAVDLGGTHIRAALYHGRDNTPLRRSRGLTPQTNDQAPILDALADAIRSVLPPGDDIAEISIAVGTPGPVDPFQGVILSAPNIPSLRNLPLRDWLAGRFPTNILVGNDANLAALGEFTFGAGQGAMDIVYLTLGTGIGGGVITNGRLLLGNRGLAAELGHVTIDPLGPICGCGHPGHLEALASGPAIAREARTRLAAGAPSLLSQLFRTDPLAVTAEHVADAARQGDQLACTLVADMAAVLARFIADCLAVFSPQTVILGGGVMGLGELLLAPIRRGVANHAMAAVYLEQLTICAAQLGDDAGLLGGLALCLNPALQPGQAHV